MTRTRLAAPALALALACLATAAPPVGFVSLFDGKTLDGWKVIGGKAEAWGVEDGLLVSRGEGGGWLGSTKVYSDFAVAFEFRLTPGSNSGLYLRAPGDASHISRTGMEIQLLDETHPKHKGIKDWQRTGAVYHVAAPRPGHNRPIGEWNAMEVTLQGAHIVVRLNGAVVVDDHLDRHPELEAEHTGLKRREGLIGLQSHNGRVEFRDIAVKTLSPR